MRFYLWKSIKAEFGYLAGANNIKIRRKVVPGDRLRLEIEITKKKGPIGIARVEASVNGETAVTGELTFAIGKNE